MKIMYVEDNPANLSLLQRIARMGNHTVISYTEGESALENFEQDKPDLVLMDVQLSGGLTGLDVVRQLRGRGHRTPIVAVTAYAMTGDKERCIEAGCDTYIAKPLPVQELVELVQRYENIVKGTPVIKPLTGMLTSPTAAQPAAAPTSEPVVAVPPFVSAEGTTPNAKAEGDAEKPETKPEGDAKKPEAKAEGDAEKPEAKSEAKPEDQTESTRLALNDPAKAAGQQS